MIPTAEVLTAYETCPRKAHFLRSWGSQRISPVEMVRQALDAALRATESQDGGFGEMAGSEIMALAEDRGLELPSKVSGTHLYPCVIQHACLADLLATAIRKPSDKPWLLPEDLPNWRSACYLSPDGRYLRRIVLVSSWNEEREKSESRSWYSLGEIAHYDLPMQMVVLVIGPLVNGLRQSPWVQGFLHPSGNGQLRFRKKYRGTLEEFKGSWHKARREDHAEISREKWLESMLRDDVLPEVCFNVSLPVLPKEQRNRVLEIAKKRMERIEQVKTVPEIQFSGCDWPVPCVFRKLCHSIPSRIPSEAHGFVSLQPVNPTAA